MRARTHQGEINLSKRKTGALRQKEQDMKYGHTTLKKQKPSILTPHVLN